MFFSSTTPAEYQAIVERVLPLLLEDPTNPLARPEKLTFAQMEQAAFQIGQQLTAKLTQAAAHLHAHQAPDQAPCPTCQQPARVTRKKRLLITPAGNLEYEEPASHCVACRRDFFPTASGTEAR
jgi:uncharacterized paraquat-inducible protein A